MMDTETRASEKDESTAPNLPLSDDSDSSSDGNSSNREENRIEWLATTRKRRSTAGNRMKSMLANEEPDSDLELLFAEDEDDQAFSEAGDDGSDVQMDSSSDDEDDNNNNNGGDDLEGEKELERRAKERRAAQRKRKTQEAIPAKFRKKVRIDSATPTVSTPASTPTTTAQPRSKKKSERMSWLPSMTDMPTRASSRQTTRMSKEQLHQQMVEREARRLKQLDQMQKKAAKLEALKKPPMTQEDRLREAAIVEQRNSKSLNRWEVAEKQREEERRAKLAALHERTLKGPVITFWSGLGHSQRIVVVEEKPKKKREKVDKSTKEKDKVKASTPKDTKDDEAGVTEGAGAKTIPDKEVQQSSAAGLNKEGDETSQPPGSTSVEPLVTAESKELIKTQPIRQEGDENLQAHVEASQTPSQLSLQPPLPTSTKPAVSSSEVASPSLSVSRLTPHQTLSTSSDTSIACESLPLSVPSPAVATPTLEKEADGNVAPQRPQLLAMPPPPSSLASGLAAPFSAPSAQNQASPLATPAGISMPEPNGKPVGVLAAPVLALPPSIGVGFGLQSSPKSHVLAPPNTSQQRPAPLPTLSVKTQDHLPSTGLSSTEAVILNQPLQSLKNEAEIASGSVSPSISEPPTATGSSADLTTTRNTIILQNFDETAIRDKSVQTHILFGRKMNKLSKPTPAPICVITNHIARYRDPKTGLPYYNVFAYREIQRLRRGEHRWSKILGAWVGSGTVGARGVPERFLNPDAPRKAAEDKSKETDKVKPVSSIDHAKEETKNDEQPQPQHPVSVPAPAPAPVPTQLPLQASQLQSRPQPQLHGPQAPSPLAAEAKAPTQQSQSETQIQPTQTQPAVEATS